MERSPRHRFLARAEVSAVAAPRPKVAPGIMAAAPDELSTDSCLARALTRGGAARAAIVTAHFDLMRDHLEGEKRVFASLADRISNPVRCTTPRIRTAPIPPPA